MWSGDQVGEFSDFLGAGEANGRPGPVNVARGLEALESFVMTGARLIQFPRTRTEQLDDIRLLERSLNDYAGLRQKVASSDKMWTAVWEVTSFLRKLRGPTGRSELLVLSRVMRRENPVLDMLNRIAPWISNADRSALIDALQVVGFWDQIRGDGFDAELFHFVVSNGHYAALALDNAVRFSPENWTRFEEAHHAEPRPLAGIPRRSRVDG